MKKLLFGILILWAAFPAFPQANIVWPDSLNTARHAPYLSRLEKEVIFEMNKARSNPRLYAQVLKTERKYYRGDTIVKPDSDINIITFEGLAALDECIAELEKTRPVCILRPDDDLSEMSRYLAADQSSKGGLGHLGSDGTDMGFRVKKFIVKAYLYVGENISYGYSTAQGIVSQLLIDDGIEDRGHRRNLMNVSYDLCGVSAKSHPRYGRVCVINYAKYIEKHR